MALEIFFIAAALYFSIRILITEYFKNNMKL